MEDSSEGNITTRSLLKGILATEPVRSTVKRQTKKRIHQQPSTSYDRQDDNSGSPSMNLRSKMKERVRRSLGKSTLEASGRKRNVVTSSKTKTKSVKRASYTTVEELDDLTPRTLLRKIIQHEDEVSMIVSQRPKAVADDDQTEEDNSIVKVNTINLSLPDVEEEEPLTVFRAGRKKPKIRMSEFEREVDERLLKKSSSDKYHVSNDDAPALLVSSHTLSGLVENKLDISAAPELTLRKALLRRPKKVHVASLDDFEKGVEEKYQLLKGSQERFVSQEDKSYSSLNDLAEKNIELYVQLLRKDAGASKSDRTQRGASKLLASTSHELNETSNQLLEAKTRTPSANVNAQSPEGNANKDYGGDRGDVSDEEEDDSDDERGGDGVETNARDDDGEADDIYGAESVAVVDGALDEDEADAIDVDNKGDAETDVENVVDEVDREGDAVVDEVDSEGDAVVDEVDSEGDAVVDEVDSEGDAVVDEVDSEGDAVVDEVDSEGDAVVDEVDSEGDAVVDEVDSEGDAVVDEVDSEGDAVVDEVDSEGDDVVDEVDSEGDDVVDEVDSEGDAVVDEVDSEGDAVVDEVDSEGDAVVDEVDSEGDAVVDEVDREGDAVIDEVDSEGDAVVDEVDSEGDADDEDDNEVDALVNEIDNEGDAVVDEYDNPDAGDTNADDADAGDDLMDIESNMPQNKSTPTSSHRKSTGVYEYSPSMQHTRLRNKHAMQTAESINLHRTSVSRPEESSESSESSDDENLDLAKTPAGRGVVRKKEDNQLMLSASPDTPAYLKLARFATADKPAISKKIQRTTTKSTKPKKERSVFSSRQLKHIFTQRTRMRIAKDAMEDVEKSLSLFLNRLAIDLSTYAAHANRKTITRADMELLMSRQRLVNDTTSLNVLIEKHLPWDSRTLLIPCATSGNQVLLKM